jgi:hypothetical protein
VDVFESDPWDEFDAIADKKTDGVALLLVQARDGSPEPASNVFSPIEITLLEA